MTNVELMKFALRLFMAGIFLTQVSACGTSQKKRDEASLRLRIGTSLFAQGQYPGALRELLAAENLDPENEIIQNNLGLTYFMREKYDLASEHLLKALDLKPSYSEARNNYGRVLIEVEKYDLAVVELKKVVADLTYDDPVKAWVNLGLAYFRKGDFKEAKEMFLTGIRVNRNHCLGQTMYGRSLFELADFKNAAQALDNAVLICRPLKFEEPYYYSGLSYYKLGRTSTAVARMEEILSLYPKGQFAKKARSALKSMK